MCFSVEFRHFGHHLMADASDYFLWDKDDSYRVMT